MKRLLITGAVMMLATSSASAQVDDQPSADSLKAIMLYSACTHPPGETREAHEFAEQTCVAYMRGLTDGLFMMQVFAEKHRPTCLPSNGPVSNAEARSIFESWLKTHPELTNNSAGLVASYAIMDAYRYQKSN